MKINVICTVYAKASVAHMTTGHAYSRALRAHYLTQEALATILLRNSDSLEEDDRDALVKLYQDQLNEDTTADESLKTTENLSSETTTATAI